MINTVLDRMFAGFDQRFVSRPSWVVLVELFLGLGWLRAAAAKVTAAEWWSGHEINEFIDSHQAHTIGWYRPVADLIGSSSAVFAVIVLVLQFAVAIALLSSVRIGAGLLAAIFLNVNFLLVGAPNPSAFYLVLQLGLVLWLFEESVEHATSRQWLPAIGVGFAAIALCCVPYVETLDPSDVIEDPAAVLAAWALLGAFATTIAHRRVRNEQPQASHSGLTPRFRG